MFEQLTFEYLVIIFVNGMMASLGLIVGFLAGVGVAHLWLTYKLKKTGRYETKKYIWTITEKKDV